MYIYKTKFEGHSEELIKYEMTSIFKQDVNDEFIITDYEVNPNRSYYLNYRIDIMASGDTVDEMLPTIKGLGLDYNGFKIEFIDVKSDVMAYNTRINYCRAIADLIEGYGQMKEPSITFVVTLIGDTWYFGKLIRNDRDFEKLQAKLHTYSHSMSCELSRTVVNIACGQSKPKLIDPCCGIGTVIAEAIDMGYEIEGTELNWLVFDKARSNLEKLGMPIVIKRQDMHEIETKYDVSILDIPYGLMSKTTAELQTGLISKCFDISDKLVLVSNEDASSLIANTKWSLRDKITIPKANYKFTRYVYILDK